MEIREAEPETCREAVVDLLWEHRHWPGATPREYLRLWDRRYRTLSDGEPRVWIARENGRVVGHIALFLRRFRVGDVELSGAVTGDLLVRGDRRHTLLGIQLLSIPHGLVNSGRLDFVYTFPNPIAYRLAVKLGWHDFGAIHDHVDVRSAASVLRRRTGSEWVARLCGGVAGAAWQWRRRIRQRPLRTAFRRFQVGADDGLEPGRLDRAHWRYRPDRLVGADSAGYLVRRFLHDPSARRRLFVVRDAVDGRLEGHVIVEFRAGRASVCDCRVNAAALDEATAIALAARHLPSDVEVFSVPTLPQTHLAARLRALGFLPRAPRDPYAEGVRCTVFFSPRHPHASTLAGVQAWNLYRHSAGDA